MRSALLRHKILVPALALFIAAYAPVTANGAETVAEFIRYHLEISLRASEYLDELFQEFSEGYMEAEEALAKLSVLKNEYIKSVEPIPEEAERLHDLMKRLISRIENYFIYYKRANRENPFINFQIIQTRQELAQEAYRLQAGYQR